jgi:hypothetical protein
LADARDAFPLAPDAEAASYYVTRRRRAATADDFDVLGCCTTEELVDRLQRMWTEQGREDLVRLAPEFAALAAGLAAEAAQEEVDPFVYVMY